MQSFKYYGLGFAIVVIAVLVSTGLQIAAGYLPAGQIASTLVANLSGITIGSIIMVIGFLRDNRLEQERQRTAEAQQRAEAAEFRILEERQRAEIERERATQERENAVRERERATQERERADRLLGRLMEGVDALPHAGRVVLVVVSDHGMAAPDPDRTTVLRAEAELAGVRLAQTGPAVSLHLGDAGGARALRDRLNARLAHARAYLREELPAHLHARGNRRLGDLVVLPDGLGMVLIHPAGRPPAGMHGWDPTLPEMRGIFLAAGPGIAAGAALPAVDAVDVYPLLCHLLGLTPNPEAAGSLDAFAPALREAPARQDGSGHAPRAHSVPGRAQPANAKQGARAGVRAVRSR